MNVNIQPSKRATLLGVVDPDQHSAGAYSTAWIAMADIHYLMALIGVGVLGASGTVDAKIEQATDGSGTGAKDVTGKAITQLTQAGTDSDKQVIIELRPEELDMAGGFTHARVTVTVATAASYAFVAALGFDQRQAPLADLASVDEIVA